MSKATGLAAGYAPGDVLADRYRLIERLGAGAHGIVYRARDLETRDEVAVKVLTVGKGLDPELNRRFEREAVAMARLRGTHAVFVHRLGLHHDGLSYLVMEMLHGSDLEKVLGEAERAGGRMKPAHLLTILRPVAATLELAHAQRVLHRDLKPSNLFLVDAAHGGGVRVLDFGLAKLIDEKALTQQGTIAGTPSYIAPEAWSGDSSKLDGRIDVYALGVIVFRALSGQLPHPKQSLMEQLAWAQRGQRPSLHALRPSLPPRIDEWVQRALAADPAKRFADLRTFMATLEGLVGPRPDAPF
jgi:eukaryotic-like serine/threonine-protein kinase